MGNSRRLVEYTCTLMRDKILSDLKAALDQVWSDRADEMNWPLTLEMPEAASIFFHTPAQVMKAPALFIIAEDSNYRKREKAANHINSLDRVNVAIVVEDRTQELLTKKAWRYHAALHQVLDQAILTSSDQTTRLAVVVTNSVFSPHYSDSKNPASDSSTFRQEFALECSVEHWENF